VMMPLAFWDSTRKGLSCLLKVAAIMLLSGHEPALKNGNSPRAPSSSSSSTAQSSCKV
jgi:hypothetical protein